MKETIALYGIILALCATMFWPNFTRVLTKLLAKIAARFPHTEKKIEMLFTIFQIPHQPIPKDREYWQRNSFWETHR